MPTMALPSEPLKAIFPIVAKIDAKASGTYIFLGTGFFVGAGTFITAKHVCEGVKGNLFAVQLDMYGQQATACDISNVKYSKEFDIAKGTVTGFHDIKVLTIATRNPPVNLDILTMEFSGTRTELKEETKALVFNPFHRKGHIVQFYLSNFPERTTTSCFEVSFPALSGASGAPVILENDGSVVGMIVENVQHELLQSHIETVVSDHQQTEEIKYVLPYAKAISWKHLGDFIAEQ